MKTYFESCWHSEMNHTSDARLWATGRRNGRNYVSENMNFIFSRASNLIRVAAQSDWTRLNTTGFNVVACSSSAAYSLRFCESVKRMDAFLRKWNRNWLQTMSNALHWWISITVELRFIESLEHSHTNWLKRRDRRQCHLSWDLMRKYQTNLMNSIACCLHLCCQ